MWGYFGDFVSLLRNVPAYRDLPLAELLPDRLPGPHLRPRRPRQQDPPGGLALEGRADGDLARGPGERQGGLDRGRRLAALQELPRGAPAAAALPLPGDRPPARPDPDRGGVLGRLLRALAGSSRSSSSTRTSPPTTRPARSTCSSGSGSPPPDGLRVRAADEAPVRRHQRRLGASASASCASAPSSTSCPSRPSCLWWPLPWSRCGDPGVLAAARSPTTLGSSPETRSARVTCSSTVRRLARTAIQTSCRCSALPRYSIVLRRRRLDVGDRALDGADDVGDRHLVGGPGQPVAALGAAAGADDAVVLELEQDVLEELQGDVLGLGEALALDRPLLAGGGQLGSGPHRVVGLRGNAHGSS